MMYVYGTALAYNTSSVPARQSIRLCTLYRDGRRLSKYPGAPEQILKPLWKALPWPYIRTKYC